MKIARFQMDDGSGRIARFEVPDDTTPEQAQELMEAHFASSPIPQMRDQPSQYGSTSASIPLPDDSSASASHATPEKEASWWDKAIGAGERDLNFASGIAAAIPGGIAAVSNILTNGKLGSQEGVREAAQRFHDVSEAYTYQPRTEKGREYAEKVGQAINASGIIGVPQLELMRLAETARPAVAAAKSNVASRFGASAPVIDDASSALRRPDDVNTIRLGNTEAPGSAVRNRYDASGNRIVPPEPVAAEAADVYSLTRQAEGGLTPAEQMRRAQVLDRIGMSDVRESAITGDSVTSSIQAQIAKFTEEAAGRTAKEMFDIERNTLKNYAENIVRNTDGSLGMDETALNAKGQAIATPFDNLREYFNSATKQLYKEADERAGGMAATPLEGLSEFLNTEHHFSGKAENGSLGNGIKSYLRHQNIMDKEGNLVAVTPQQAEGIKQYINSQWSPGTSELAGQIKNIIDNDVFASAGEDIYAQARNMFKMKKATLDNPNGVSKLMDFDPQTPINRTTSFEKIPDTLTRLPATQFKHVIDTLNKILDPIYETPESLKMQAQAAINEIKAHMANALLEAGEKYKSQWNAKGVTQYLKNNSSKFRMVFNPNELAKIRDLNDAGHILSTDKSYPGSAAQASIALKRGLLPGLIGKSMAGAGGAAGGVIAGPFGSALGASAGSAIGNSTAMTMGETAALRRFNKGIVNVADYTGTPRAAPIGPPIDRIQAIKAQLQAERLAGVAEASQPFAPAVYSASNKNAQPVTAIIAPLLNNQHTADIIKWATASESSNTPQDLKE